MRRGGNISVDVSLFVFTLLYNTNFRNKNKFNDKKSIKKTKNALTIQMLFNLLRGKVGQLCKKKRVLSLSIYILLVYGHEQQRFEQFEAHKRQRQKVLFRFLKHSRKNVFHF